MNITAEEWTQISSELELHHAIFYQLWQMGKPVFADNIKTAAVAFDPNGDFVQFIFNPEFWDSINLQERKFVICHEALHVILNHGIRTLSSKNPDITNIALDIVVNHSLVEKFGFNREDLPIAKTACWVDTIFTKEEIFEKKILSNQSFEYYYLLMEQIVKDYSGFMTLDDHGNLGDIDSDSWGSIVDKLDKILSGQEKQAIKDVLEKLTEQDNETQSRGTESLGAWHFVEVGKVKEKKKWETVIKKWSRKYMKPDFESVEQWARRARRFATLSTDLLLPTDMEEDHWTKDKIQVWFFQDCSGSCINLKGRFFAAAKSLPKDRFEIKMHTFDTRVFELEENSKGVWGGGGTSFSCLETYLQRKMKENETDYPAAVFVISDGYGDMVQPAKPENWFWFLSTTATYCIPKTSNIFQLADFE